MPDPREGSTPNPTRPYNEHVRRMHTFDAELSTGTRHVYVTAEHPATDAEKDTEPQPPQPIYHYGPHVPHKGPAPSRALTFPSSRQNLGRR